MSNMSNLSPEELKRLREIILSLSRKTYIKEKPIVRMKVVQSPIIETPVIIIDETTIEADERVKLETQKKVDELIASMNIPYIKKEDELMTSF